MAKVTSKLQVTIPKAIADRYGIRPGDEISWEPSGPFIRVVPPGRRPRLDTAERLRLFDAATQRQMERQAGLPIQFVAATTRVQRTLDGQPLLSRPEAYREAEELLNEFTVLYPTHEVLVTAFRGAATYQLSWFDAHLWAYAEIYDLPEILTEDFQHGRIYGTVRATNPFFAETIHEPAPRYG